MRFFSFIKTMIWKIAGTIIIELRSTAEREIILNKLLDLFQDKKASIIEKDNMYLAKKNIESDALFVFRAEMLE